MLALRELIEESALLPRDMASTGVVNVDRAFSADNVIELRAIVLEDRGFACVS